MHVEKRHWTPAHGWQILRPFPSPATPQLVLVFGAREAIGNPTLRAQLREWYPAAHLTGCSTSGEIAGTEVADDGLVTMALHFEHGTVRVASRNAETSGDIGSSCIETGRSLAEELAGPALRHVLVFSDGIHVNGSALAEGFAQRLPPGVVVTGGLAGDAARFEQTLVLVDDRCSDKAIVAIGLYGERLHIGHGSLGGWDPFGPERVITRSKGNVLYELDGAPALDLYKTYLGPHAKDLPGSGLLFPLNVRPPDGGTALVRTILGVDEANHSLTFAGDVPEGYRAQLMKANFDRLIDGAQGAAVQAAAPFSDGPPAAALLISCVGRKLVLRQRIEEEVEGVRDTLGHGTAMIGFYSYGEIAPGVAGRCSELHNQTMTITTFDER